MVHKATTTLLKCSKAPEIWIQNRIVRIWKLCGKLEILSFCTHYPLHPPLSLTPPPAFPFLLHFFLTPSFIISEVHLSLVTVSSVTELQCKEGGGGGPLFFFVWGCYHCTSSIVPSRPSRCYADTKTKSQAAAAAAAAAAARVSPETKPTNTASQNIRDKRALRKK